MLPAQALRPWTKGFCHREGLRWSPSSSYQGARLLVGNDANQCHLRAPSPDHHVPGRSLCRDVDPVSKADPEVIEFPAYIMAIIRRFPNANSQV